MSVLQFVFDICIPDSMIYMLNWEIGTGDTNEL